MPPYPHKHITAKLVSYLVSLCASWVAIDPFSFVNFSLPIKKVAMSQVGTRTQVIKAWLLMLIGIQIQLT